MSPMRPTHPLGARKAARLPKLLVLPPEGPFVAIDFETADNGRDSACAVALVRVEGGQIVERASTLIRPPRQNMLFTWVHGLTWKDVAEAPSFGEVWPTLTPLLEGAAFLAAHNAGFDRGVLKACCERAELDFPATPFLDTVRLARHAWQLPRNNLPTVAAHLGLRLNHHDALSDAEACAGIVMAARGPRIL
jgi:DNA polymerase III subunit epsilon